MLPEKNNGLVPHEINFDGPNQPLWYDIRELFCQ